MWTIGHREPTPHRTYIHIYKKHLHTGQHDSTPRLHLQLQYQCLRINWLIKINLISFPLNPSILYRKSLFTLFLSLFHYLLADFLFPPASAAVFLFMPARISLGASPPPQMGLHEITTANPSTTHPPILPFLLLQEIPQHPEGEKFFKSRYWCKNLITFDQNVPSINSEMEQGFLFYFVTANTKAVATFLTSSIDSVWLLFLINSTSSDNRFLFLHILAERSDDLSR